MGKEGILLRLVEAMNLIDKDNGARAVLPGAIGIAHDLLDFLDAGQHRGTPMKLALVRAMILARVVLPVPGGP